MKDFIEWKKGNGILLCVCVCVCGFKQSSCRIDLLTL